MTESVSDLEFMGKAMDLAREAAEHGEVPIGAVVARSGQILSMSRNRMEELQDASAHAEILPTRNASAPISHRDRGALLCVRKWGLTSI